MLKSKNTLFTIAIIFIGIALVFNLVSDTIGVAASARISGNGFYVFIRLISLFTMLAGDILLLVGLLIKKKNLIVISYVVTAGLSFFCGILSFINSLVQYGSDIWAVSSFIGAFGTLFLNLALAAMLLGLFRMLEEPEPEHPFAAKPAPKMVQQPYYGAPGAPAPNANYYQQPANAAAQQPTYPQQPPYPPTNQPPYQPM